MKYNYILLFVIIIFTSLNCKKIIYSNTQIENNKNMLEITIDFNKKQYSLADSIIMNVEIKNKSNEVINFFFNELLFDLSIKRQNNHIGFYNLDSPTKHGFGKKYDKEIILKRNEIYKFEFNCENIMPKTLKGKYNLSLLYHSATQRRNKKEFWVGKLLSNSIKVFLDR
jgi:hypothetical protein